MKILENIRLDPFKATTILLVIVGFVLFSPTIFAGVPLMPHVIIGEVDVNNGVQVEVVVERGDTFYSEVSNGSFVVTLDSGEGYWSGNKISFFLNGEEAYEKWIFRHGAADIVSLTFETTIFDEFKNEENLGSCSK